MLKQIRMYKEDGEKYKGFIKEPIEVGKRIVLYADANNDWLLNTTSVIKTSQLSTGLYKISTQSGSVYYVISE